MAKLNVDELFPGYSVTVYLPDQVNAVELTMAMTGKDSNHSCEVLRRLSDDIFNKRKMRLITGKGKGNTKTYSLHFKDAIELIMVLPGKAAKQTRQRFADIITRYFAGDDTLIPEVQANAASTDPINSMARKAVKDKESMKTAVSDEAESAEEDDKVGKKRQLEREDMLLALEVDERRQKLKMDAVENVRKGIEVFQLISTIESKDQRFAMQLQDLVKNILLPPGACKASIADGSNADGASPNPTQSVSISVVAAEMGFSPLNNAQAQAIGKRTAAKYRAKYNCEPTKHSQNVGGNYIPVNSYTERDRGMIEEAVREVMESSSSSSQGSPPSAGMSFVVNGNVNMCNNGPGGSGMATGGQRHRFGTMRS